MKGNSTAFLLRSFTIFVTALNNFRSCQCLNIQATVPLNLPDSQLKLLLPLITPQHPPVIECRNNFLDETKTILMNPPACQFTCTILMINHLMVLVGTSPKIATHPSSGSGNNKSHNLFTNCCPVLPPLLNWRHGRYTTKS